MQLSGLNIMHYRIQTIATYLIIEVPGLKWADFSLCKTITGLWLDLGIDVHSMNSSLELVVCIYCEC